MAVDLDAVTPAPAAYQVRTRDGSLVRAKTVVAGTGGIAVDGKVMADVADVLKL
jgi:hypothetical protein